MRGTDKDNRRMIYYTQSPHLSGPWNTLQPMFGASPKDDVIGAEVHNMSDFRYHNIHIGIAGLLYVTGPGAPKDEMPVDGPIDAHLICSRDGFNWNYPDAVQTPVLSRGEIGEFDGGMIMRTPTQPIIEIDEIHWYYTGARHTHGPSAQRKIQSYFA